jgi:hypothetical protein
MLSAIEEHQVPGVGSEFGTRTINLGHAGGVTVVRYCQFATRAWSVIRAEEQAR